MAGAGSNFFCKERAIDTSSADLFLIQNNQQRTRAWNLNHELRTATLGMNNWEAPPQTKLKSRTQIFQHRCFKVLVEDDVSEDFQDLLDLLICSGKQKNLQKVRKLHALILQKRLFLRNTCINNAILNVYAKCGAFEEAERVLEAIPEKNVVSWNALIAGYAHHGLNHEALTCFERMKGEGIQPNSITFICILKACTSLHLLEVGEQVHEEVKKQGLLKKNVNLGNALVDMYAKCSMLGKAQQVFNELPVQDVVSWNSLISGYVDHGITDVALKCFMQMQFEGISPDTVTLVCLCKACHSVESLELGEMIHREAIKKGLLGKSIILANAIMDMYAKCKMLDKVKEVFDELPNHDAASWNTLINAYSQHGREHEALDCFLQMQQNSFSPSGITFVCILKACGNIGALQMGKGIHAEAQKRGLLKENIIVGNSVIDMYVKCGMLEKAKEVFDRLPLRNSASWNALLTGYAQLGEIKRVLGLLNEMLTANVLPDFITFLVLLNAYSHCGLVEEGGLAFCIMEKAYCITPTSEHYACMVDLFSRAGHFDKAIVFIEKVIPSERLPMWWALLGACCKWLNVRLGRWAFQQSIQLDKNSAATYVCMRNIYASVGMFEEAKRFEAFMVDD